MQQCDLAFTAFSTEFRKTIFRWRREDVLELRTQEATKRVKHFLPAIFWILGRQHYNLQSFQLVVEHLALVGEGNRLLHGSTDAKELRASLKALQKHEAEATLPKLTIMLVGNVGQER